MVASACEIATCWYVRVLVSPSARTRRLRACAGAGPWQSKAAASRRRDDPAIALIRIDTKYWAGLFHLERLEIGRQIRDPQLHQGTAIHLVENLPPNRHVHGAVSGEFVAALDRKSTRLNSSHANI